MHKGILIGYARVSTQDQNLALQDDALKKAGCKKVFRDMASGVKENRKGLLEAIEYARKGDCIVVWKLDRLGRSLRQLLETVRTLEEAGIGLKSLQERIDTTTSGGKLIFHLFGALAEFERDLIRERTRAGLAAARARGRIGGRPFKLGDKERRMARTMWKDKKNSIREICDVLKVSKATLYRAVKQA